MKVENIDLKHIIYFHGFNSSPESKTCCALRNHFGNEKVVAPFYDYINPDNAYKYLESVVHSDRYAHDVYLVGTSLGAFWANYFSEKYRLECILINPSLRAADSLKKYLGMNTNFYTGEKMELTIQDIEAYNKYPMIDNINIPKTILLGGKDEVVSPAYARAFFKNHAVINDDSEGHEIKDKSKIIKLVESAINNIHEPQTWAEFLEILKP